MTESVLDGLRTAQQHDSSDVLAGLRAEQSGDDPTAPTNNIGYLQQIQIDKKRKERERKESQQPIKTDDLSESVSRELGVPEGMLDTGGAGFGTRFNFSFSDDDEDIRTKFKKMHPNGEIYRLEYNQTSTSKTTGETSERRKDSSVLVYRENAYDDDGNVLPITEDSKVKTIEGEGQGLSDIADLAGPSLPLAGAIALPLAGPTGVIVQSVLSGFGWAAGEFGKHEINIFGFDSDMSQKDALADAAREGRDMAVITAVTGGLYKGGKKLVQKSADVAVSASSPELKAVQQRAMKFVEEQKVATLDADQLLQENMIVQRLGKQARSTSATTKHKSIAQKSDVTGVALDSAKGSIEKIGERLVNITKNVYRSTKNSILNSVYGRGRVTLEQGGIAVTEGGRAWQKSTKDKVDASWAKVDEAAATSKPVFSLNTPVVEGGTSAHAVVHDIKNFVNAEAKGLEAQGINVADTPLGSLRGIIAEIDAISNQQFNYEVIKQLRTKTGKLIERWPWNSSVNSHNARTLYRTLTDVLMNPVNKGAATSAFTTAAARANGISRGYYEVLDDAAIRRIIQSEEPAALAANLGTPGALTPNIRNLVNEMPGGYAKTFKESVVYNDIILNPAGSMKSFDNWVTKHPEGLRFLMNRGAWDEVRVVAGRMDSLRNSNVAAALEADVKSTQVARTILLKPGTGPSETKALIESIGPEGRELLRNGIYHDIVDRSVASTGKYGQAELNADALSVAIKEYKSTGAWQHVLTAADRSKITGMKAYIDIIYKGAQDAGVSLEAAKAITELKSPATFISGAHKLGVNALVARVMRSRAFTEWAISHNAGAPVVVDLARSKVRAMALITEALMEGIEPGQNVEPVSPYLDAVYEAAGGLSLQPIADKILEMEIPNG